MLPPLPCFGGIKIPLPMGLQFPQLTTVSYSDRPGSRKGDVVLLLY